MSRKTAPLGRCGYPVSVVVECDGVAVECDSIARVKMNLFLEPGNESNAT